MKTKFLLLATAIFCLASCNNAEFDNSVTDLGGNMLVDGDIEYMIEVGDDTPATKGSKIEKTVGIASFDRVTCKANARLKKRKNGEDWKYVDGAYYTWSGTSYFAISNVNSQECEISGVNKTSTAQTLTVKASLTSGGSAVATNSDSKITVNDDIFVDWEKSSMILTEGETASNTITCNNKTTVTCPSNCIIGKSSTELSSSSVDVDASPTTIYIKYTGSSNTTLSLKAVSVNHSAEVSITAKKAVYPIVSKGTYCLSGVDGPSHPDYGNTVTYDYLSTDKHVDFYSISYEWDTQFGTTICTAEVRYVVGYMKDDGTFVKFSNYKVYSNSNCTTEINYDLIKNGDLLPWPSSWTGNQKRCNIYIKVNDEGYDGVYIGDCYMIDSINH